jgi:signal transduction histidine kinase
LRQRRADRQTLLQAIYERLEPLATRVAAALDAAGVPDSGGLKRLLRQLSENLNQVKALSGPDTAEVERAGETDQGIRSTTMRIWLRLAAVLMAFFVLRNLITHSPFVPSLFSLAFCVLVDLWLTRPESAQHMELTALAVGLLATGPLIVHIREFGGTPDAPPLVIAPSVVLFTALLSQGPAAFALIALNVGILIWVGHTGPLALKQMRLLGDLALTFVVVVLAESRVFALRRRYARALLDQRRSLAESARQQRRLAGTLFHDVSNHAQTLTFYVELDELSVELRHARSLGRRVQRLIALSKEFLLPDAAVHAPRLEPVRLGDAVESVREAFAPRLQSKGLRFDAGPGLDLGVRAQVDLLIESVLGNLVSNAIKFSNPGTAITFTAERVGANVRIVVADQGPGFPAGVLQRLGEDGALPSRRGTAGESGQGYGLHLAFDHLQRMGGRLQLGNRAGGGAEATVWLPAA